MISKAKQKNSKWLKHRKIAIIAGILAIVMLSVSLAFVLEYVKIYTYEDTADGTRYYIRNDSGSYALYDKEKNLMPGAILEDTESRAYFTTYAGTVVEIKKEDGTATTIAMVDLPEHDESRAVTGLLMFPQVKKDNIRSLEIHNSNGVMRFARFNDRAEITDDGDLLLVDDPRTPLDTEAFASVYVAAGYAFAKEKLGFTAEEKAKYYETKVVDGETVTGYFEYGLVPEMRVDEDGNEYKYVPDYYILTDKSGQKYKVVIGDALLSGDGYYVQYHEQKNGTFVPRDTVYIISASSGKALKSKVESLITPILCYPMTSTSYYKVQNFMVLQADETSDQGYFQVLSASYIPIEDRLDTIDSTRAYVFEDDLSALLPDTERLNAALQGLYAPTVKSVYKFAPTMADMAELGLYRKVLDENGDPVLDKDGKETYEESPAYRVHFDYTVPKESGDTSSETVTVRNYIIISAPNENGNYYAYSYYQFIEEDGSLSKPNVYSWVSEVAASTLSFVEWNRFDWIDEYFINLEIPFCDKITVETPDYSAVFDLDNSATPPSDSISSDRLTVTASDTDGNNKQTFQGLYGLQTLQGSQTLYWDVTSNNVKVYDADGTEWKIDSFYYDYNVLGVQVVCLNAPLITKDGTYVYVNTNSVKVVKNGVETEYVRYDTALFRHLYATFTVASIVDVYELDAEKEAALLSNPDNLLLTLKVTELSGSETVTNTYCFYSLYSEGSSRKVYLTVNGVGGFYVLRERVDKFVSDCRLFFDNQVIDYDARH